MAGNKQGGLKAAQTNKIKHGSDFYSSIGSKGGKKQHPNKGFGSMTKEQRQAIGKIGGSISKRKKKNV